MAAKGKIDGSGLAKSTWVTAGQEEGGWGGNRVIRGVTVMVRKGII